jgi:hypothetical protein
MCHLSDIFSSLAYSSARTFSAVDSVGNFGLALALILAQGAKPSRIVHNGIIKRQLTTDARVIRLYKRLLHLAILNNQRVSLTSDTAKDSSTVKG